MTLTTGLSFHDKRGEQRHADMPIHHDRDGRLSLATFTLVAAHDEFLRLTGECGEQLECKRCNRVHGIFSNNFLMRDGRDKPSKKTDKWQCSGCGETIRWQPKRK